VVEEQRAAGVQARDSCHLVLSELEVEDVDVLAHPLGADRLRNHDDVALRQPTQDDLSNGLPMSGADLEEGRVGEDVVLALRERAPRLVLDAVLAHDLLIGATLVVRVRLDLIDGRRDVVVIDQVDEAVGVEVRHADRLRHAVAVELLHGAPRAVVVAEGLVNQVEVHVVEPESLERRRERAPGGLLARVDPELGCDEELLSRNAALSDRSADGFFVPVGLGRVQQAVAGGERVAHGLLCLLRGDLVNAEAKHRHHDAILQGDPRDLVRDGQRVSIGD
jgi:hypothetical protein